MIVIENPGKGGMEFYRLKGIVYGLAMEAGVVPGRKIRKERYLWVKEESF